MDENSNRIRDALPVRVSARDGEIVVEGDDVSVARWAELGVNKFAPGRTVTLTGTNLDVATTLFWQFGASGVDATTDFGDELELRVGYSELLGLVVVPFLNGDAQEDQIEFLPWTHVDQTGSRGSESTGTHR